MPLTIVQKRAPKTSEFIEGYGTQYIDGTLRIEATPTDPLYVHLTENLFGTTGKYILFEFTDLYVPDGRTVQYVLNSINVLDDALQLSGAQPLVYDGISSPKRIILPLGSKPDNGCQYISNATFTLEGPLYVELSPTLYATPGEYWLFDWSDNGQFVGDPANIFLAHGGNLTVGTAPYRDDADKRIKFTLV